MRNDASMQGHSLTSRKPCNAPSFTNRGVRWTTGTEAQPSSRRAELWPTFTIQQSIDRLSHLVTGAINIGFAALQRLCDSSRVLQLQELIARRAGLNRIHTLQRLLRD